MEIPENPPIPNLKERYSKLKFTDPTEAAIFIAKDSYNSFYPLNFEQGKKFRCPNCQFCMELVKTHENGQLFFIPVIKHEHRTKQCKPSNNIPKILKLQAGKKVYELANSDNVPQCKEIFAKELNIPNATYTMFHNIVNKLKGTTKGDRIQSYNYFSTIFSIINKIEQGFCEMILVKEVNNEIELHTFKKGDELPENSKDFQIYSFIVIPPITHFYMQTQAFCGIIQIDGTFLFCIKKGNLLIIGTPAPNNRLIPIAFAWSVSENTITIKDMLTKLKSFIPPSRFKNIYSDQGPAIIAAVRESGFSCDHKFCLRHFATKREYINVYSEIVEVAYADHPQKRIDLIKKLETRLQEEYPNRKNNQDLFKYLDSINPFEGFADYTAGILTTSLIESLNAEIKDKWDTYEPAELILRLIEHEFNLVKNVLTGDFKSDNIIKNLNETLKHSDMFSSVLYDPIQELYYATFGRYTYCVKIMSDSQYSCTCKHIELYGLPCIHVIAVLNHFSNKNLLKNLNDAVHARFKCSEFMTPVEDLMKFYVDQASLKIPGINFNLGEIEKLRGKRTRIKAFYEK
ncbi:mutator transposase zinc finger domain family [Trichomonas vaginalis G3]|uniref:mutator transposase zinc finger domain family n=1 Tax=Trichomonas vaginalis (strain ATCC PRA-98 / G3) TaxID=412133 RepID=UPI0021E58124|nr:mutator transposase zinc finger domain family [Trichomonas vaginalis G3]KAI5513608.1 mutator transposase zinc finger domain family [Trichomonas vaginalis G3]